MTVSTTTTTNSFSGNGSTVAFAYTFKIFATGEMVVILRAATGTETVQTATTHYSVSGVGSASGGTVTFVTAPASGVTVLLKRATAQTQATDYVENDPFPAATHEDALDKLTHASQELQEEVDRSIKLSRTNTMTSTEFTQNAAARASKVLSFDSSGELSVAQELGTFQGNWSGSSTDYVLRDIIKDTSNGNIYICVTAHTSSGSQPISGNTDSAKWSLIVDAASATTSATTATAQAVISTAQAVISTTKAAEASTSASAGATSATAAAGSATSSAADAVSTAADLVLTAADQVSADADATSTAADAVSTAADVVTTTAKAATATTQAATATTQASNASTSASTATTQASTATTQASNASTSASGASTSASTATTKASEASTSATAAATSATASASSATAAAASALSAPGGLDYVYSTTTTDADPGNGVIRFNHATLASASAAYLDDNDANSVDVSTHVLTWDDSSTTSNRGTVKMTKKSTQSTYALYTITGASTDASGYVKLALTFVAGNGTFSNSDTVSIQQTRTGDTGSISAGAVDLDGAKLTLDGDGNTSIQASTDNQIDIEIAGADDFRFTANTFSVLSGSTLNVDSGATIVNSGTATGFGVDSDSAVAGIIEANAAFVDMALFGPAMDKIDWSGRTAASTASLMLATVETAGQVNIWDVTGTSLTGLTALETVTISGVSAATSIAAVMGYIIVGSEDGIAIIDPHSGAWAERTVGWPRTLSTSTTPALTNADVKGVAAGFSDQPALDPRTGGPMPIFWVAYGTGADVVSLLKDDGNVWDAAGTIGSTGVGADNNGFGYYADSGNRIVRNVVPASTITADDWTEERIVADNDFPSGIFPGTTFDINGGIATGGGTGGLSFISSIQGLGTSSNADKPITSAITRAYNTGYMVGDIRGAWLANSETADRSYKGNTLTKTTVGAGSITEVSADGSSGELKAYRFQSTAGSTISFLKSGAADTDYDFGTADFSVMFWAHLPNVSADQYLWSNGYNSGGYTGGGEIAIEQNADESVSLICSDDSFGSNDQATTGAGLLGSDVWTHVCCYRDGSNIKVAVNGVLEATAALTNAAGSLTNTNSGRTMNIASSFALAYGITDGELALFRVSAGSITSTQIRQIYDAEKGMFVASAECLLQSGTTDAVLDVSVDPITAKVAVTQADSQMIFNGLVVESTPAVNSGDSEHNILYGGDRFEINSANLYATVAAKDLREDMEIIRGLKAGLPAAVDLGKAKAWIYLNMVSATITASYNVKSVTDNTTGDFNVNFAIPFKSKAYAVVGAGGKQAGNTEGMNITPGGNLADTCRCIWEASSGANVDTENFFVAFFGELENE